MILAKGMRKIMQNIYRIHNKFYYLFIIGFSFILPATSVSALVEHQKTFIKTISSIVSYPDKSDNDNPVIDSILLTGNKKISSEKLLHVIPLHQRSNVNETKIMQSMFKIAKEYKKANIKVTITPIIGKVINNHTSIQFDIHEK